MIAKSLLVSLSAIVLSAASVRAQQPKIYRVGAILPGGPLHESVAGLKHGLGELGLEEGRHVAIKVRETKGDSKLVEEAARSFERERFNLIYALTTSVALAAKIFTERTPIVFAVGSDPVAAGLVASYAKPGGRLTGLHYLVRELTAKRLEVLKEILPKAARVVSFYDPGNRVSAEAASAAREEAARLGLRFIQRHVASPEELERALYGVKTGEADAFFYLPDAMVVGRAQLIIDAAKSKKIATMFHEESLVAKGALASYGQNYHEVGRLAAKYVHRVLRVLLSDMPEAALVHFRKAAEADPNHVAEFGVIREGVWTYVGRTQYELDKLAEARTSLQRALQRDRDDSLARLYLGLTLLKDGDRERGVGEIEKAMRSIHEWLESITYNTRWGPFWDPRGEICSEIDTTLGALSSKQFDPKRVIASGESVGRQLEQEIDRARYDEVQSTRRITDE